MDLERGDDGPLSVDPAHPFAGLARLRAAPHGAGEETVAPVDPREALAARLAEQPLRIDRHGRLLVGDAVVARLRPGPRLSAPGVVPTIPGGAPVERLLAQALDGLLRATLGPAVDDRVEGLDPPARGLRYALLGGLGIARAAGLDERPVAGVRRGVRYVTVPRSAEAAALARALVAVAAGVAEDALPTPGDRPIAARPALPVRSWEALGFARAGASAIPIALAEALLTAAPEEALRRLVRLGLSDARAGALLADLRDDLVDDP